MDEMSTEGGARSDDGRDETPQEKADRNWNELLQELRVTQTGVQILTGFLLTLPFQQRFERLDSFEVGTFLVVVIVAAIATGLFIAPVSLHRALFGRRRKDETVAVAHRLAQLGLGALLLAVAGAVLLVFSVVVGRPEAVVVAAAVLVGLVGLWGVLPLVVRARKG